MNKEYGFIVKFWHIIVVVLGFVFTTGGAYYKVLQNEKEIDALKEWKEKRIDSEHLIELDISDIKVKTNLMYDLLVKKELEKNREEK